RMNGSLQKALQQQQPPQPTATPPPTTPTTTPLHPFGGALATPRANGGMDWPGDLDKVATIVKASFAQTLQGGVRCECGRTVKVVKDPAMALRLASTFARMYTAKMGGDRVSLFLALNQPPPPVKDVEIRDVIAALRRHDTGLDCLLCGQPKPASQVVIDVPLQEEGGES
ncbi:MAG: hypothetical protein KAT70_04315, partial [Thermoplasmata archaeon]|nr:hypothetical protein [Thermoplasmata archaeon]